jgi:hypothetical protein
MPETAGSDEVMGLLGHKENAVGRETEPLHPLQAHNRAVRPGFPNQAAECSCARQAKRLLARLHALAEKSLQPMVAATIGARRIAALAVATG